MVADGRIWVLLVVSGALAFLSGALFLLLHAARDEKPVIPASWEERIRLLGAADAYALLKHELSGQDPNESHVGAHEFGNALYRERGMSGIGTCDQTFLYGCMHAFVARAISENGLDVVGRLFAYCHDDSMCTHAIGHGLVAHLGYDPDDVRQAVDLCASESTDNFFNGCGSGVFMEHFLRGMNDSEVVRREDMFNESKNVSCDVFSGEARGTCYFWRPQLEWERGRRLGRSRDDIFSSIAAYCNELTAESHMYCVSGAGQTAVSMSDYRPDNVSRRCAESFSRHDDVFHCLVFGGRALAGGVTYETGKRVCDVLRDVTEHSRCADIIATPLSPIEF